MYMMRKKGYYLGIKLERGHGSVLDWEELGFANESITYLGGNEDNPRMIEKLEKKND